MRRSPHEPCARQRTPKRQRSILHLLPHRLHRPQDQKHPAGRGQRLGKERVAKIYDLADVYHSDNLDRVRDDFIEEAGIPTGTFDNVAACGYAIPSHWDIGKVYKRLIKQVAAAKNISIVDALFQVYNSFLSDHIDDYNSSVYYENPSYLFESFMAGHILDT